MYQQTDDGNVPARPAPAASGGDVLLWADLASVDEDGLAARQRAAAMGRVSARRRNSMLATAKPPVINGIDAEALDRTVDSVRRNPARGEAAFLVTTEWKGRMRSESVVSTSTREGGVIPRSFTVACDEPDEMLGDDSAPNPQELLISAVNSCLVVGYVMEATRRGIALSGCRIETSGELDLRGFLGLDETIPVGYRRICYTVILEGDASRDELEDIHQAVMATSPNYFNMAQPVQMVGRLA
jgi:uncharacterized OsmC-like protein